MIAGKCLVLALCAAPASGLVLLSSDPERRVSGAAAAIPGFAEFWQASDRSYSSGSAEYAMRRSLYGRRASAAARQNSQPGALWTAGVSFLWDRTEEEFAQLRGWKRSARPGHDSEGRSSDRLGFLQRNRTALPENKSWVGLSTFGVVPNQGPCGSCWAIAGARVLQAHSEIHTGQLRTFSAQQLVSCVPNPQECGGQGGCQGATVELAYAWIMKHGLVNDSQVPYSANNSECCLPTTAPGGAAAFGMTGWARLPENEYEPLMRAVVEHGPVAVSVAARYWGIYDKGIFNGCPKAAIIDHAVVLIAFGAERNNATNVTTKFWTLQNSWGPFWGENGKIRLLRQDSEQEYCGINDEPESGTGCLGGPEEVTVCGMCGILYDSVVPFF